VYPAPEEITSRPHLRGLDVGLWGHPPTQEHGDFLGIDFVVFGFTTVDGFHIERVPEDKGNAFLRAEVSEPGPR
jgi:hypothetical protein